jgi:RNA-directed DNA polymerase
MTGACVARVAEELGSSCLSAARRNHRAKLTTLVHHIDEEWLHEAYRRTRKDGARGIDGQSGQEYATGLKQRLESLLERAKTGRYRAPPVRRVHIPKGSGETRPLGIPTFEDKVLQRAVAMVLEAIYEQDFLDCSYGFRPGRSAHQALDALHDAATRIAGGWVVELDIRKYVDTIDHEKLVGVLRQRVRDGAILPARGVGPCGSAEKCSLACEAARSWCATRMMP